MEPEVYYQPPDAHDNHIRAMVRWLAIFFGTLVLIGAGLFFFAHKIVEHLPFSVEKRFVKPYEVMAGRWLSDHLGDPEVEVYLQNLTDELAVVMDLPEEMMLSVHYVDDSEANAFATLGGHIFVLRGLVEMMPDENSLAMILAHEISHIQHRDPIASLGRGVVLEMLLSYFAGGSRHGENLSTLGGHVGLMNYSRKQESRSDLDALKALNTYYGHVAGYDYFFREMSDIHIDATIPNWLQTHPDLKDRIESLEMEIAAQAYSRGQARELPDFIAAIGSEKLPLKSDQK
ncbi:MAG: M48 family metallopeptidase [Verrucomicrobiota bacterium]